MAFDVGIADLVGSLFFGGDALAAGAADVGAADLAAGAGLGADIGAGATAADLGAGAAGAGLAGEVAAGTAPEVLASAAPGIAAGDIGAQTAAEGGLAAGGVSDALAGAVDTVPEAVDTAGAANLGSNFGLAPGTSTFTPTPAAVGTGAQLADTSPATIAGGVASPTDTLAAGNANINADLGAVTPAATPTGPTTAQVAVANSPMSEIVASSQVPGLNAENVGQDVLSGTDFGTQSAIANAGQPSGFNFNDVTKGVGGVLNSPWTKAAELALPVGFLGYNLLKGPPPLPSQATNAVNNASQNVPLLNATAAQDLALANANQISPAQAASIDVFTQNATNQMIQQLANEGITNPQGDSRYWAGIDQIKQQAETMKVQYINQLISTAFQAQGAVNSADSTIMKAAQIQVQQDNQFQQSIIGATQAIALMAAFSGRGGASATT